MVGGRRMATRAAAFAAASLAPLAVWLAVAGRGNRPVAVHLFDAGYWVDGFRSLSRWVLPPYVDWPVRGASTAVVAAGLLAVAIVARRDRGRGRDRDRDGDVLGLLLAAFTVAYVVLLVIDRSLLDATGRLDLRFLAVLHVVAVVGLVPWLHRTLKGTARRAVAAAGLALLGLQALYAGSWVIDGFTDTSVGRRGLTAAAWEDSVVLAAVAALPPEVPVYSNAPEAVFLLTGREASALPTHTDYLSGERRPTYEAELRTMTEGLAGGDGVVVWFRPYASRDGYLADPTELPVTTVLEDDVASLSRSPH